MVTLHNWVKPTHDNNRSELGKAKKNQPTRETHYFSLKTKNKFNPENETRIKGVINI